ncbi:MAG: hypothetical protein M3Z75_27825 [Actinomycetota bacterium]|nr:hypothetical protein [Actinomycetota bacterium]
MTEIAATPGTYSYVVKRIQMPYDQAVMIGDGRGRIVSVLQTTDSFHNPSGTGLDLASPLVVTVLIELPAHVPPSVMPARPA